MNLLDWLTIAGIIAALAAFRALGVAWKWILLIIVIWALIFTAVVFLVTPTLR